eukprot:TRINITY_DN2589_c0_g4_i2.p1 TRINITY_DN2589_c0_g4~~TRINITY_DN2589_c0_g4_i2.p1  ORF type:complete len:462 (+),score=117.94 TRINITY_DN2589_c0_g4_i2:687-2072(+)
MANMASTTTDGKQRNTKKKVISAFQSSFHITRLVISNNQINYWCPQNSPSCTFTPSLLPFISDLNIGFVDERFSTATYVAGNHTIKTNQTTNTNATNGGESWFFYNQLKSKNLTSRWRKVPVGGAVPRNQKNLFKDNYQGQDFALCSAKTHSSFVYYPSAFSPLSPEERERISQASQKLGYNFHLRSVHLKRCHPNDTNTTASSPLSPSSSSPSPSSPNTGKNCVIVDAHVINMGNAPFYYPIYLAADLLIRNPPQKKKFLGKFDLSQLQPNRHRGIVLYKRLYWNGDLHGNLSLYLVTNYANRPIVFSSNGVDSDGKVTIPLPDECQSDSNTTIITNTTTAAAPTTTHTTHPATTTTNTTHTNVSTPHLTSLSLPNNHTNATHHTNHTHSNHTTHTNHTIHPTNHTIHPTNHTIHPTNHTVHPNHTHTNHTSHPTNHTIHPTNDTIHPTCLLYTSPSPRD